MLKSKEEYVEKGKTVYTKDVPNLDPTFFHFGTQDKVGEGDVLSKPYQYHSWVNASARTISTNISSLHKILKKKSDPETNIVTSPILEVFDTPNEFMPSSIVFWQAIVLNLLLNTKKTPGGQCFLIPLTNDGKKVNLEKGEIPDIICPFNDDWVHPVTEKVDGKNGFKQWEMKPPGASAGDPYEPYELIRIHLYNPYNLLQGMSFLTPQLVSMIQDVKASAFNESFLDNGATLSGLLTSDQHLTTQQYKQYLAQWNENFAGRGSNGRTALLGMGLKYQPYGQSHADMQYMEQSKWNKDKTLAAFGVNKIAIGDYEDINFATIREGRKILWQDTYQPLDILICQAITNQWVRHTDPDLFLTSDYDAIPALQKDWKTLATASGSLVVQSKFPPALAAKTVGIKISEEDLAKYPHLSADPTPAPPVIVPEPEKGAEFIRKRYEAEEKSDLSEKERIALSWDYINKVLVPGEKEWIVALTRFFNSQRNRMQDLVDEWLKTTKSSDLDFKVFIASLQKQFKYEADEKDIDITPAAFLLDNTEEAKKLVSMLTPLVKNQMLREQARLTAELGNLIEWHVNDPRVANYVQSRTGMYNQINTTTFKVARNKIAKALRVAVETNASPGEAAKLFKEAIADAGEIRKNQAKTIARTETGTVSSVSRYEAFRVEGIEWGEWLNAADELIRDNHQNQPKGVGGMVLRIGEIYPLVFMRFPLDPTMGAAKEKINCRCVQIAARAPKQ